MGREGEEGGDMRATVKEIEVLFFAHTIVNYTHRNGNFIKTMRREMKKRKVNKEEMSNENHRLESLILVGFLRLVFFCVVRVKMVIKNFIGFNFL